MKTNIKSKFIFILLLVSGCHSYIGYRKTLPASTYQCANSIPASIVTKSEHEMASEQKPLGLSDSSARIKSVNFKPQKVSKKQNEMVVKAEPVFPIHKGYTIMSKTQTQQRKPTTIDVLFICMLLTTPLILMPLLVAVYYLPRLWRRMKSEYISDRKKIKTGTIVLFSLCTGVVLLYLTFLFAFLYLMLSGKPWFG